jgi:hypothetical protein
LLFRSHVSDAFQCCLSRLPALPSPRPTFAATGGDIGLYRPPSFGAAFSKPRATRPACRRTHRRAGAR